MTDERILCRTVEFKNEKILFLYLWHIQNVLSLHLQQNSSIFVYNHSAYPLEQPPDLDPLLSFQHLLYRVYDRIVKTVFEQSIVERKPCYTELLLFFHEVTILVNCKYTFVNVAGNIIRQADKEYTFRAAALILSVRKSFSLRPFMHNHL